MHHLGRVYVSEFKVERERERERERKKTSKDFLEILPRYTLEFNKEFEIKNEGIINKANL